MNRKELAACLFLATSCFTLGWVVNSKVVATQNPSSKNSELWLPDSISPDCKNFLRDIHANFKDLGSCNKEVQQSVVPPHGVCRGLGANALKDFACKGKAGLAPTPKNNLPVQNPASIPPPIIVPPSMKSLSKPSGFPAWLSPYCVEALKAEQLEHKDKNDCLAKLKELSAAPKGQCRFDYALRFANDLCSEQKPSKQTTTPTISKAAPHP